MQKLLRDLLVALPFVALLACGGEDPEPAGECGNFTLENSTEQCDLGPTGGVDNGFGCTPECTIVLPEDEVCDDGEDNDFDGDEDCEDSDCSDAEACQPPPEICDDAIDNDEDGDTDCDDSDCTADLVACPVASDEVCDDGIDNDFDGDTDCDDDDCDLSGICEEICDDEFDNDSDGALDCLDSDCAGDRACPATCGDGRVDPGEQCDDGLANGSEPDTCRTGCLLPRCGDGVVDSDEECDTGAELGSPSTCWQDCTVALDVGCGTATLLDAEEVASPHAGGFNFSVFGDYTEDLGDDLSPPTSCSNRAPDGEDLVLHWVPEVTGWYQLNSNFNQVEGDSIFWVMDGGCGGDLLGCAEDSATNGFGTILIPAQAGSPLAIAVDFKGEFTEFRLVATRVDEFVAPGASCNSIGGDVCELGYECNDALTVPLCQLPMGTCQNAEDISGEFLVSFDGSAEFTRNTARHDNISAGTCGGESGPEYVATYTNATDTPVSLTASGITAGSTAHIARHCGAQASEILCTGAAPTDVRIEVGETVFVTVESGSAGGGFESFRLVERPIVGLNDRCDFVEIPLIPTILCDDGLTCDADSTRCLPATGTSCAAPYDANQFGEWTDGELEFTLRASDGVGVIPNLCSPLGADLVARYVPQTTGTAIIELNAGSATIGLSAQRSCSGGEGFCIPGDAEESTLYAPVTAGEPIFLIADPVGITGVATITISEVAALELGEECVEDGGGVSCGDDLVCATDDGGTECRESEDGMCGVEEEIGLGIGDSVSVPVGHGAALYETSCGSSSEVFGVAVDADGILVVVVEDESGRRDTGLAARGACGDAETELLCEVDAAQPQTRVDLDLEAGARGFFHATNVTSGTLTFTLVPLVGLGEVCDPDGLVGQCAVGRCVDDRCTEGGLVSCDAPAQLLGGDGDAYAGGTSYDVDTADGASRSLGICGGSGSEYMTTFTAPADGVLSVSWQATGRVAVLYARSTCDNSSSQIDCDSALSNGGVADLELELTAEEEVFLVFDSDAGSGVGINGTATVLFAPDGTRACGDEGFLDVDETDVDCGGPFCGPCSEGAQCDYARDCASNACVDGECSAATHCVNDIRDEDESDLDCGGADCPSCFIGDECSFDDDCASRLCGGGTCDPSTCDDDRIGGEESDIDCGGPFCELCDTGDGCFNGSDCVSGFCDESVCTIP